MDAFDAPAALRQLIAEGSLTEDGIQSVTGIGTAALRSFVSSGEAGMTRSSPELSAEESTRLSIFAAQLVEGMAIADDERVRGILESLITECRLTSQNIAQLTGLDAGIVDDALNDPHLVPAEQKYEIAVRASYLLNAIGRASNR